jgi:hypothetical protein
MMFDKGFGFSGAKYKVSCGRSVALKGSRRHSALTGFYWPMQKVTKPSHRHAVGKGALLSSVLRRELVGQGQRVGQVPAGLPVAALAVGREQLEPLFRDGLRVDAGRLTLER